jgi:hypothetical protein
MLGRATMGLGERRTSPFFGGDDQGLLGFLWFGHCDYEREVVADYRIFMCGSEDGGMELTSRGRAIDELELEILNYVMRKDNSPHRDHDR